MGDIKGKIKPVLFIAALTLLLLPGAANAYLTLKPGVESSTSYLACSNTALPADHSSSMMGTFWPASNSDSLLTIKTFCVSAGGFSSLQQNFDIAGNTPSNMGWTAATTGLLLIAGQTTAASSPYTDSVQGQKKPDPIPSSILLFAPGLAGILVRRNWPQKFPLRTLKRSILELIHHASGFPDHGNLQRKILLTTGFAAYFQFVHFKLRTIQLNR